MSGIDIQQIERKMHQAYHQDGLLDIVIGLFMLFFALQIITKQDSYLLYGYAVIFLVWVVVKKFITRPRIGYARLQPLQRSKQLILITALLFGTFLAGSGLYIAANRSDTIMEIARALGPMPFGWMIAMLILTIGVMYGLTRLVVYAGLTATAVTVCYLLNLPNSIYLVISGAMITLSGIILLIHFIQQNPVDEDIA